MKLREAGVSVREAARQWELSTHTVVEAHKAFRRGGWNAVSIHRRGRPVGSGPYVDCRSREEDPATNPGPHAGSIETGLCAVTRQAVSELIEAVYGVRLTVRNMGKWPALLAYSIAWNEPGLVGLHRAAYSLAMDNHMQSLAEQEWHVCYVSLYAATCSKDGCIEYADEKRGIPLLTDADHLSKEGSVLIAGRMAALHELRCLESKGADDRDSSRAHM